MMFGSIFMLIFGLFFMLLVIALPILLIGAILASAWGLAGRRGLRLDSTSRLIQPMVPGQPLSPYTRFCSHCGQGLQGDWTTCPKCGAPV